LGLVLKRLPGQTIVIRHHGARIELTFDRPDHGVDEDVDVTVAEAPPGENVSIEAFEPKNDRPLAERGRAFLVHHGMTRMVVFVDRYAGRPAREMKVTVIATSDAVVIRGEQDRAPARRSEFVKEG